MSLKGSLESFSFPNILQMISLEKKTGVLQVEQGETSISVSFREGNVIFAQRKGDRDVQRLKYTLVANKMLPKDRLLRAVKEQKNTLEPIWTILSKHAPKKALEEMLERQVKDCLFLALQWETGMYQFDITDDLNVPEEVRVVVGIDNILMEGCRVADEWKRLSKTFPSGDSLVKRAEGVKKVRTENERLILSYLKEGLSIHTLINVSKLGEFETCEAVRDLLKRGSLLLTEEKKKTTEKKSPQDAFLKKTFGLLVPSLVLLVVFFGVLLQAEKAGDAIHRWKKESDYVFKEISRYHLDFIFSRLQLYTAMYDEYPQNLDQLVQMGLLSEKDVIDKWGNPIQYGIQGNHFSLYSTGRLGQVHNSEVVFGE